MKLRLQSCETPFQTQCPNCQADIGFFKFSGMGDMAPHFYCDTCSNVYFDVQHRDLIRDATTGGLALEKIVSTLPDCPCGGRFRAGMNPKCPKCQHELAHGGTAEFRLHDPFAIVVEGAFLVTPDEG